MVLNRRTKAAGVGRKPAGFSLVEVVLAIGVVAFAFVALFGLLPTGLSIFRKATDTSVGAQIFQKIVDDARQTDYLGLVDDVDTHSVNAPGFGLNPNPPTAFRAPKSTAPTLRYFDEAGTEIVPDSAGSADGSGLSNKQKNAVVYYASTRIMTSTGLPRSSSATAPVTGPNAVYPTRFLATVSVQIAYNPGNVKLTFDDNTAMIKTPPPAGVTVTTYTALVAKND